MSSKSMRRVLLMSAATSFGADALETLKEEVPKMIEAINLSRPPVSVLGEILLKKYGAEIRQTTARQFIGLGVGAILQELGYEISARGVRISGDPVFRSGALYRLRVEGGNAEADDALDRMMKSLSPDQAKRAYRALVRHFPELKSEANQE